MATSIRYERIPFADHPRAKDYLLEMNIPQESIIPKDFKIKSEWKVSQHSQCFAGTQIPMWIADTSTERLYLNESKNVIRTKCALLALGTPIIQPVALIFNVAFRFIKLISFSHFWAPSKAQPYSFKARLAEAGKDLLRIVAAPLALIGLLASALYGIINPHDGRKLYATLERAFYSDFRLAPCFQPSAKSHFFRGDIMARNVF